MAHTSEYEIEDIFIDRLEGIGYKFIKLNNYDEVLANFREQLAKFNAKKLEEKGHAASFSDSEFNRIMIHVDNHSVYESAKVLRDKYDLQLDNGESVYIEFFSGDTDRNIYQVTHQVTITRVPLCTNQSLCAIETNDDICDDYLYQYLQTQYNNLRLISSGDGTRGGLNLKLVGGYVVSMPCFIEQQKIVACLSALDDVIEKKKATLAAWEELKKGLLQQMFV